MAFFGLSKKSHKGTIDKWYKAQRDSDKAWFIYGYFIEHPTLPRNRLCSTSRVVNQYGNEVETLNSRYTLGTPRAEKTEEDNF